MVTLVTGASGFIGRNVMECATSEAVAIAHRWRDRDELTRLLPERVDRCIHLGWYAKPADYLTNADGNRASLAASIALVEELEARGCRHLVVTGSCGEYRPREGRLREEDETDATTPYAGAKLHFLEWLRRDDCLVPFAWARLFNVTGRHEPSMRVLPQVARAALRSTPIALSEGDHLRDYVAAPDVAAALWLLSDTEARDVYNVCTGIGTSVREMALRIVSAAGVSPSVLRFGARPYGPHDQSMVVGDPTRIARLGWAADTIGDDLAAHVLDWAREEEATIG